MEAWHLGRLRPSDLSCFCNFTYFCSVVRSVSTNLEVALFLEAAASFKIAVRGSRAYRVHEQEATCEEPTQLRNPEKLLSFVAQLVL